MRNRLTLRIAEPCSRAWDEMDGTGPRRNCRHCQTTVHDLSALDYADVVRLVDANPAGFCARYLSAPGAAFVVEETTGRRPAPTAAAIVLAGTLAACGGGHDSASRAVPAPSASPAAAALSSPADAPTISLEQCERLAALGYVDCSALRPPKPGTR